MRRNASSLREEEARMLVSGNRSGRYLEKDNSNKNI